VRRFFAERGVLEVDTPVLGHTTVTDPAIESLRLDAGGRTLYLQTSPEYHMKRLLAAGAPSIVRIGPVFRDDETGRLHNCEFVMVEWYRLGFGLNALMDETAALVDTVLGPAECKRLSYGALLESVGVDADETDRRRLAIALRDLGRAGDFDEWDANSLEDLLVAEALERHGPGRFFVTEYPPERAALAKLTTDASGRTVAARFELVVDGIEIANGYDELDDGETLAARMEHDRRVRRRAGRHVPAADARLLAALRSGLPPCAGVALGFDRLLLLARRARALAEVMPFPIERA
jgi:lysyl-tRNA synthetase class 2